MMESRLFSFFIILLGVSQWLFGGGVIEESDIPMPEVQYDLPPNLVGDFIIASFRRDRKITIFSNNKFITLQSEPDNPVQSYGSGYVIHKDGRWYFSPAFHKRSNGLVNTSYGFFAEGGTEIMFTDSGFYFYTAYRGETEYEYPNYAFRPVPLSDRTNVARGINIPQVKGKNHYYIIRRNEEQNEVDYNAIKWPLFFLTPSYHSLKIVEGDVQISRFCYDDRGEELILEYWNGFMESTECVGDVMKGIIRFTNGSPYYFVENGSAEIEITSEKTTVTMKCTTQVEKNIKEQIPDMEPPVYMVFEF